MALNSRASVDPRWFCHNLAVESGFNLAKIEIFESNISDSTYNATTNAWTGTRTVLWTGNARIQPINRPNNRSSQVNPTTTTEVEVHFNYAGELDLLPGTQIFVTKSKQNPALENVILTVRSSVTSSTAWNHVLVCEIDEEVRRSV